MEEKIIIKGTFGKTIKNIKVTMYALLALSALFIIILLVGKYEAHDGYWKDLYENGFIAAFNGHIACLIFFIFACCLFSTAFILFILFLSTRKCSIIITESYVKGTAVFGKEVVLPLDMISTYATKAFFSTISIATSSGFIKFSMIENYKEIGDKLAQLINERQNPKKNPQHDDTDTNSSFEKIKKYKELLDNNIITQEEFETKKKQILGL